MRARRHELDWTQDQLAARAGTSQAVIQKIENGHSKRPRILEELAHVLGVRAAWLAFGEGPPVLSKRALDVAARWDVLNGRNRLTVLQLIARFETSENFPDGN